MNHITAQVADITIGNITIAGLMDEKGNYYVGVPQLNERISFSASNNTTSRDLKRLLGKDFRPSKAKTNLYNQLINAIPILEFEKLLAKLDRAGNIKAQQLRDDLVGLSLHQLLADAFHQKFEAEDRQQWLKTRQSSKITRRLLTDAIKDYCDKHPERSDNYRKFIYNNCTDKLYRALFKKPATKLREELNCVGDLRAFFTDTELMTLERHEDYATRLIDKLDIEPQEAISQAIDFYS